MKILGVRANNHRKAFEVRTRAATYRMPYARVAPRPGTGDPVVSVRVDDELGREGFTYELRSGAVGSVHLDAVLDENQDPAFVADLMICKLTIEAQERVEESGLSRREIAHRLRTSVPQVYRLLDQTNYGKSVRKLLALRAVVGCDVEIRVKGRTGRKRLAG